MDGAPSFVRCGPEKQVDDCDKTEERFLSNFRDGTLPVEIKAGR
jgi:hypothetical protein